jgi:hypothetical protein
MAALADDERLQQNLLGLDLGAGAARGAGARP